MLNEIFECEFTGLDYEGMGVTRINGIPIFVNGALKGEKALVKVIELKKNIGFGRIVKFVSQSDDRVLPKCRYYNICGGCNIMHMSYESQLEFKKQLTIDTFNHVGHFDTKVNDCVGSSQYNYRNKVQIPFGYENGIIAGFYEKGSHKIVNLDKCFVEPNIAIEIIDYLKVLFNKYKISIYNETTNKGIIRHAIIKVSRKYKDLMVVLVTNNKEKLNKALITDLVNKFNNIKSIIQNINMKNTNVIMGNDEYLLYGKNYILDSIFDLDFEISSRSFYQINSETMENMYKKAMDYLDLNGNETIIDAYSGIGTISLSLAKRAKKVYGIEIVDSAVNNANCNKLRNKIDNVEFILGPCEKMIRSLVNKEKIDAIVFDPPRKGCDKYFLDTVIEMKIERIVYISCNIRTQARDIAYLLENGYQIIEATPFDMFPNTSDVETVALLCLKNAENK